MKQLYTSLLTGAALLVSGAVSAQTIGAKMNEAGTMRALSYHALAHVQHAGSDRGTAPVNDGCASVTPQALAIGATLSFSGTTVGATSTGDALPGTVLDAGGDTTSVWHAITTSTCADVTIAYCGTDSIPAVYWAVLATSCPADANVVLLSGGNFTNCADGNATIIWSSLPAGTYYIPVRGEPSTAGPYTIAVSASGCTSPPSNDECAGAIPVTVGSWCNFTTYSSVGATESLPAIACNGFTGNANDDVWFSFVATNANMSIGVQGSDDGDGDATTGYDAVVELFEGACPGTSIGCADATLNSEAEEIQASGLTVGNTYYVRTYHYYTAAPSLASFGICVVEGAGINIGIEENTAAADWSIYPNPGTGLFNIQYNGANTATSIEVIDITGRVVYTERTSMAAGTNHPIDLSGMAAGNYNVRLTANGVRTEQRLAVK